MELALWLAPSFSVITQQYAEGEEKQAVHNISSDGSPVAPERWYSCDVFAHQDFPRYKSTYNDAVGGGGGGVRDQSLYSSLRTGNKWLTGLGPSELCEKLWKASQCYSNQVPPGLSSNPEPEEASTVLMTE